MLQHMLRAASQSYYTLTYVTNLVNTSNLTTYTFTSASIGAAAEGRRIVVVTASRVITISSITVAGQSCTQIFSGPNGNSVFISPVIATGTTANIVVTASAAAPNMGIGIYTINGTGNYAITNNINYQIVTNGDNQTTNSTTVTVPNYNIGDSLLWNTRGRSAHAGTWSFSGTIPMTENYDVTVEAGDTGMTAGINNATDNYVNGTVIHTTSGASPFQDVYVLVRFF